MQFISPEFTKDIVTSLKVACAEAGTDLTELCRRAGVHRTTIEQWKEKPPKTVQILERLQNALQEIKTEKHAATAGLSD